MKKCTVYRNHQTQICQILRMNSESCWGSFIPNNFCQWYARVNFEIQKFGVKILLVLWFSIIILSPLRKKQCFLTHKKHVSRKQMAQISNKYCSGDFTVPSPYPSQTPQMNLNSLLLVYFGSSEICKWHIWS